MPKEKKTRRSKIKHPGLTPRYNSKIRQEQIDYDYIHKLSDAEKDWLNRFSEEYIGANFQHPGDKVQETDEERRECYNRNNSRNRCVYSIAKAKGAILNYDYNDLIEIIESEQAEDTNSNYMEEALIEYLDGKNRVDQPTDGGDGSDDLK